MLDGGRNPARKRYHASITLTRPEKTLATEVKRHDLLETFAEIGKQREAQKATLRGDPWWQRRATRGSKSEPEIERILEYGRRHLRQSLAEAGCTFIIKDKKDDRAR